MVIPAQTICSLFSGIGGLDESVRLAAPGSKTVVYVERESYAVATLCKKMEDKILDEAPIWDDITSFDGKPWRGKVSTIIGGFPCTDLSVAGKKEGIVKGNRSGLFYEYVRLIGEIRPRYVFVENVSGLLDNGAMGIVLGEFSKIGLSCQWGMFSASGVGSSHQRQRVFALGYAEHDGYFTGGDFGGI
ncbi:MAG: hypothetical protein CMC15_13280 [Flavobacteriaceae bacterium]|nr:hypothetical protein [Flavobacteriaceae bacterium]